MDRAHFLFPFVVALPELVASSYAAIFMSRWIWRPPSPAEFRSAAQTLCRLQGTASDEPKSARLLRPAKSWPCWHGWGW